MNRRLALSLTVITVGLVATLPSEAARPKPKPKPIKGSYSVMLPPDPSKEATSTLEMPGCSGLSPASVNHRAFTAPAAGTLVVKLLGGDPTNGKAGAGFDWDLYVMDRQGELSAGDGATSQETAVATFKRRTTVSIDVCNLNGLPEAKISYTFTYK